MMWNRKCFRKRDREDQLMTKDKRNTARSTLLQLLWVTGSSSKKRSFDISHDICHENDAVRNEYDMKTEKGEEVM